MHHVSDDVRARRSAGLIWEGLVDLLHERPLARINISDVCTRSYVSRTTFYRLFDDLCDVLAYECDLVYMGVPSELDGMRLATVKDALTYFVGRWLAHGELVAVLAKGNLTGLVLDAHLRNAEVVREVCAFTGDPSGATSPCLDTLLASLVAAAISTWCAHGGATGTVAVVDEVLGGVRALTATLE